VVHASLDAITSGKAAAITPGHAYPFRLAGTVIAWSGPNAAIEILDMVFCLLASGFPRGERW